jgi:hypothetical protein
MAEAPRPRPDKMKRVKASVPVEKQAMRDMLAAAGKLTRKQRVETAILAEQRLYRLAEARGVIKALVAWVDEVLPGCELRQAREWLKENG